MWLIIAIGAIIFAILNIVFSFNNKNSKWFGFISLSLTALTVCAFYSEASSHVLKEDWSALMDVIPTVSKMLWFCVFMSILINAIPLFRDKK